MNKLETMVPLMETIKNEMIDNTQKTNKRLKELGLRNQITVDESIKLLEEQIKTSESKYTIAFVGTFNTGKSTIINSLLNLKGKERLSTKWDPDTAKCIRLIKKENNQDFEAEILFYDGMVERMKWEEAVVYTSQPALDGESDETKNKSNNVEEIRYYVDSPFLYNCNILDLPGTGTGSHTEHTEVTDTKIMEADYIFWVVSTDGEPDRESVLNLEKFHTKMLPIINVWEDSQNDIYSLLDPNFIVEELLNQFQAYFDTADKPIIYYAKEIDNAQIDGRELLEEWGKQVFVDKIYSIINGIDKSDRTRRVKNNVKEALKKYKNKYSLLQESDELKQIIIDNDNDKSETVLLEKRLRGINNKVKREIKDYANSTAQNIVEVLSSASDSFIENTMQGLNLKALFRKNNYTEDLKMKFESNYVKLDDDWLKNAAEIYVSDCQDSISGAYIDFTLAIKDACFDNLSNEQMDNILGKNSISGFIPDVSKIISNDMLERLIPTLIDVVVGGILLAIPGGECIELALTALGGGALTLKHLGNDEKLRSKVNGAKVSARVQIRQQKYTIVRKLIEIGEAENTKIYERYNESIAEMATSNKNKSICTDELKSLIEENINMVTNEWMIELQ